MLVIEEMLDRFGVARALRELGALLRLSGEDRFRARAYEHGATALESSTVELSVLVDERRLTELPGVGRALASVIAELYATGRSNLLERLRNELPRGVIELSQVLSIGKVRALSDALKVDSIDALEAACRAGRVRTVKGFGVKTEAKLLAAIERWRVREERLLLYEALPMADRLVAFLRSSVSRIDVAGELRRSVEAVSRVLLVASSEEPATAMAMLAKFPMVTAVKGHEARLSDGLRVELHAVTPEMHDVALVRHTGSAGHVRALSTRARALGTTLEALTGRTEEEIYRALHLPFIPPELREGVGEVSAAAKGTLPLDLVEVGDVRGLVHCHTVYSDGKHTIEEMARAADELGMRYLTITDHSPAAHYAGGVDLDRLAQQWDEIDEVQSRVKVRILRGTEADILEDGGIDYPDHVLERFDVVIASVHSRMKMDEATMTKRLVRAMRHPIFKIWGHALGRLIDRRPPFACRVEEVLDAIAASRAAIEVNGDPYRLDMEPRWIHEARKRNIPFVISTDAHSTRSLRNVKWGVAMARRGGLRKREVLNTLDVGDFMAAVQPAG